MHTLSLAYALMCLFLLETGQPGADRYSNLNLNHCMKIMSQIYRLFLYLQVKKKIFF